MTRASSETGQTNTRMYKICKSTRKTRQHCEDTHHPVGIINSIHVNFCNKSNSRGRLWVSGPALHLQAVYPVLIVGLKEEEMGVKWACHSASGTGGLLRFVLGTFAYSCWPNDHACPACQSHVFVVLQAPAHRAIAFAFLALFQLLQQTKIAWNFHWKRTWEKLISWIEILQCMM